MGFNKDKQGNKNKIKEDKESEKSNNLEKDKVLFDESLKADYDGSSSCANENIKEAEKNIDKEADDSAKVEIITEAEPEPKIEVKTSEELLIESKEENRKLMDSNKRLKNEMDALKERVVRTVSEYENYRKRTIKEKESIYSDACEDVLKNIFPVFDNLERAAAVEGSAEDIKKGIDITLRQLNDALKKLNIEEISIESGFDPKEHNAVMHIADESLGKSQVVEVFQKGYKKGDKVLRYSMVKVAN